MHVYIVFTMLPLNCKTKYIMGKTDNIIFRINSKLKKEYKLAIMRSRTDESMTSDLIAHIEAKVEQDKKAIKKYEQDNE